MNREDFLACLEQAGAAFAQRVQAEAAEQEAEPEADAEQDEELAALVAKEMGLL